MYKQQMQLECLIMILVLQRVNKSYKLCKQYDVDSYSESYTENWMTSSVFEFQAKA